MGEETEVSDPVTRFVSRENAVATMTIMVTGCAVLARYTTPGELGWVRSSIALATLVAIALVVVDIWRTWQSRTRGIADETPSSLRRRFQLATASAIAFAGISALIWWIHIGAVGQPYITAIGHTKLITLPDGTTVRLNTDTLIRVHFSKAARQVELMRGEALFLVAHSTSVPFQVVAGMATVEDMGTTFSVRIRDEHTAEVLVKEGRVTIHTRNDTRAAPSSVEANESANLRPTGLQIQHLTLDETERRLEWMSGHLEFQGQTLDEVVLEFNRYNKRKLVVADASLARLRIGGRWTTTNVEGLLRTLEHGYGVQMQPTGNNEIWLTRPERY